MIYGRRFFEKSQQRLSYYEQQSERLQRNQKSLKSLYNHIQHKYARHFLFALITPLILFTGPCIYFLHENYQIFLKLAYDVRPDLILHLEREKGLLLGLLAFMISGAGLFCYLLTYRLIGYITGPVWSLERHMKQVTLGDWTSEDFRVRNGDEFQSLASTYSYLYRSLKVQTQNEIETLESLVIDPKDRNTFVTIRALIETKKSQLGQLSPQLPISANAEETSSSQDSRRAS